MALCLCTPAGSSSAKAASNGTVYTCTAHPSYTHPTTGEIEDAGGTSSLTTGQAMVENVLSTTAIFEVTSDGDYYATLRLSMMDYTSNHTFAVQEAGDESFRSVSGTTTGTGSDSNGTTSDICIPVPSENVIVRISLHVNPMDRDVVFYAYFSDFSKGNTTDMSATHVSTKSTTKSNKSSKTTTDTADTSEEAEEAEEESRDTTTVTVTTTTISNSLEDDEDDEEDEEDEDAEEDDYLTLESSIEVTTVTEESLSTAEGLSLSTALEEAEKESTATGTYTLGQLLLLKTLPPLICGVVFMLLGAFLLYLFRKNWHRWSDGDIYEEE